SRAPRLCSSETGGHKIRAQAAFADEWHERSDSVVVQVAASYLYLKEVGGFLTLAMATSYGLVPLGPKLVLEKATTLEQRVEATRARLPIVEFLGLHLEGSFAEAMLQ
ncbi:unnamed protein product, partial [Symbiodinium sp. CCMP2456]